MVASSNVVDLDVALEPFPHMVVDGWWDDATLYRVLAEFPPEHVPGWKRYDNGHERKLEGPPGLWGKATREFFTLVQMHTKQLQSAFALPDLHMETIGGGYHAIPPGGYLGIHTDFNRSPRTGRHRRLNFLVYLNQGWDDEGGHLQLWDDDRRVVDVVPEFNRTVVFETSSRSWHGHPKPASCWRRSVAAYFFTEEPPPGAPVADQSTVWHEGASQ